MHGDFPERIVALAREGIEVHLFDHRSIPGILRTIRMLGGMTGCHAEADALATQLADGVERVAARAGWSEIPAVRDGEFYEIKSAVILQPGPAALTDGLAEMHALIRRWAECPR